MTGVLYGVGVGPGNPELITVSAVRVLTECDRIAVPAADRENCTAYGIAKQVVPCVDEKPVVPVAIPMTTDEAVLAQAGIAKTYAAVNCGMPDEAVFDDLAAYGEYAEENRRYFTTLIVKPKRMG